MTSRACARSSSPRASWTRRCTPPPCRDARRSRALGRHGGDQRPQVPAPHARHDARRIASPRRAIVRCAPTCARARKRRQRHAASASACCPTATTARRARSRRARRSRAPRRTSPTAICRATCCVLKDLSRCAERRLLGRRPRDDAAHPRRRAGLAAGVLHGVREPGRFRRGHPRARRGGLEGHRRRHHLFRRADVRRRHHRAGGRRRVQATASRISPRPATTRARRTNRVSACRPTTGIFGPAARFRAGPRASMACRASPPARQRHAALACSGISPRCRPTASAARRATSTCGSTT